MSVTIVPFSELGEEKVKPCLSKRKKFVNSDIFPVIKTKPFYRGVWKLWVCRNQASHLDQETKSWPRYSKRHKMAQK